MTNKEALVIFKRQFKRWTYMVAHYGWKFTTYYYDCHEDMPKEAGEDAIGLTFADFKYLEASIYINLKKAQNLSEAEIEYVVIHELTHLLVNPMQQSNDEIPLEYTVTSIARIFQGLRSD